jgi:hypothetical protein
MNLIRIPKVYYDDHIMCEQEAPPVVRETKSHYFISSEKVLCEDDIDKKGMTTLDDLYSRAKCYGAVAVPGNQFGFDPDYWGLCRSAKHTVIAIDKHRKEQEA